MENQEIMSLKLNKEKKYSPDDSTLFLYFTGKNNAKISLWGLKLPFSLDIIPAGHPVTFVPVKLSKAHKTIFDESEQVAQDMKKRLLPKPDESFEQEYDKFYDNKTLDEHYAAICSVLKSADQMKQKIKEIKSHIEIIRNILKGLALPPQFMRNDSRLGEICANLHKLLMQTYTKAAFADCKLPPCADELTDILEALSMQMQDGYGLLCGIPRVMTKAEKEKIEKLDYKYVSSINHDEKLDALQQLWRNELLSPLERIKRTEQAKKILEKKMKKPYEPPELNKPVRHLEVIAKAFETVDKEGLHLWQSRMAEQFTITAKDWAPEGVNPEDITEENFAPTIIPSSVYVKTKEEAGKITYKLMLFFKDKEDYLSGHEMFAKIVDGEITEYNL